MIPRDPGALADLVVEAAQRAGARLILSPGWGRTLEQLGVSPATHRLKTLSAEALATSIRALAGDSRYRQHAQELQQVLSREDGVACTVNAIEAELSCGRR